MDFDISSRIVSLATLLALGTRLCTPAYQRSYSWGEQEAMALLNDLVEAAETRTVHFIGAIVLVENHTSGTVEIVDGQQRLTTLSILLSVLRDFETDTARAERLHNMIASPPDPERGEPAGWRLTLNHLDNAFFRATIQTRGQARITADGPYDSQSQRRLTEVAAGFTREIDRMTASERRDLADTAVNRCAIDKVRVLDRDMGYRVFRVLNTRGKEPNAHDIVKTELFERARFDVRDADRYASRWAEHEAMIGGAPFDDLLRQIRTLLDRSGKGDLITGYRKAILPKISPHEFLDDYLPRYVAAYSEITLGTVELGAASEPVRDYVNRMRALDQQSWRAPALKFLVEHRNRTDIAPEFFRLLERLAYAMQLVVPKKSQRDKRYRKVIDGLDNPDSLLRGNSPLNIGRDEARRICERLLGRFATFGQRRAMALRMNAALEGGETLPPEADATVEHVLPRNPEPESFWNKVWPDGQKRRELCDTLGNFILLPHEENQLADRLDYRDKKKVYFNGAGGAHFALTRDLRYQEAWTPEIVRQRTERLAHILAHDWDLA